MTGSNDTVLVPPTPVTPGMFASTGGGHHDHKDESLHHLHNNNAIWQSSAFTSAASDRFGYALLNAIEHNGSANLVATEKTGAATELAVEKTAAAINLAVEKTAAATQLGLALNRSDILAALAACCCELKEGQAATNALIREIEANRIRDELQDLKQELTLSKILAAGIPVK